MSNTKRKIRRLTGFCLKASGTNPVELAKEMMNLPFVSMHGPEHHMLDGAALLTAIHNAGVSFDLKAALKELSGRAQNMPGAMCGFWGVCGSVASVGAALAIIHETGPLSDCAYYKDNMEYTSKVIAVMSKIGGPRCCKRNAFLSISVAVDFVKEKYGIKLEKEQVRCEFSPRNPQCIEERCPFYRNRSNEA